MIARNHFKTLGSAQVFYLCEHTSNLPSNPLRQVDKQEIIVAFTGRAIVEMIRK